MSFEAPFIDKDDIERDAEALLIDFSRKTGSPVQAPVPIDNIAEKHLGLSLEFGDLHAMLGIPQEGDEPDIFGAIWFEDNCIAIHERLDPDEHPLQLGRYRFTLAHEAGGHHRLHRDLYLQHKAVADLFGHEPGPGVVCRSSQTKRPIEWQADYYAACLLMPRSLIRSAWHKAHGPEVLAVHQDYGRIPGAQLIRRPIEKQLEMRFAPLADLFEVSRQAMRIRLEQLGFVKRLDREQATQALEAV